MRQRNPNVKKRSQDSGKLPPAFMAQLVSWYDAWDNPSRTMEERGGMWFKILRENGVGY